MDCSLSGSSAYTISWSLLKCMSIDLVMLSNHFIFCHPLLLLPSIFTSIRVFRISWRFTSGGQSIGTSTVLPMNVHGWFPLGWTGLVSLLSKGLSRVFSNTTIQKKCTGNTEEVHEMRRAEESPPKFTQGTFLVVQCLRLHLPMQEVQVWSLVRELRLHMPHSQKAKTKSRHNIVTNSIKTLKMAYVKKKKILKK